MDLLYTNLKQPSIHSESVQRLWSKASTYCYAEKATSINQSAKHWHCRKSFYLEKKQGASNTNHSIKWCIIANVY